MKNILWLWYVDICDVDNCNSHSANRQLLSTYYILESVLVVEYLKLNINSNCSQENQSHYFIAIVILVEFKKNIGFLQNSTSNEYAPPPHASFAQFSATIGYWLSYFYVTVKWFSVFCSRIENRSYSKCEISPQPLTPLQCFLTSPSYAYSLLCHLICWGPGMPLGLKSLKACASAKQNWADVYCHSNCIAHLPTATRRKAITIFFSS